MTAAALWSWALAQAQTRSAALTRSLMPPVSGKIPSEQSSFTLGGLSRHRRQILHQLLDAAHPRLGIGPVLAIDQAVIGAQGHDALPPGDEVDQLLRSRKAIVLEGNHRAFRPDLEALDAG